MSSSKKECESGCKCHEKVSKAIGLSEAELKKGGNAWAELAFDFATDHKSIKKLVKGVKKLDKKLLVYLATKVILEGAVNALENTEDHMKDIKKRVPNFSREMLEELTKDGKVGSVEFPGGKLVAIRRQSEGTKEEIEELDKIVKGMTPENTSVETIMAALELLSTSKDNTLAKLKELLTNTEDATKVDPKSN